MTGKRARANYDRARKRVGVDDYYSQIEEPEATLIYAVLAVADAVRDLTDEVARLSTARKTP